MYTGVSKETQPDGSTCDVQKQCIAIGDGIDYEKYTGNPVLDQKDLPECGSRFDFRDPKIWQKQDGSYRCVAGNCTEEKDGQILLYSSPDGFQWKYEKILASNRERFGRMWECPDFFALDKRQQGLRFATPFRIRSRSPWSATAVLRILKNPVYTGILEQGKNTTLSYKVKKRVAKPRGEWAVVESAHEAVVDRQDFLSVQKVLALDTRKSPGHDRVELFSSMVLCGECGAAMVRKTVPSGGKKYIYYVCAAHKNEKTCFSHSIRDTALEKIVLESLQKQIQYIISLAALLEMADTAPLRKAGAKKVQERMESRKREADRYRRLMASLYENMVDGVIAREEYHELKKNYSELCSEAEKQAEGLQEELVRTLESSVDGNGWMEQFKKYGNITELDRTAVVSLIDRIFIYRDRRVDIIYSCQDELRLLDETLAQVQGMDGKTESYAMENTTDGSGPGQALSGKQFGNMSRTF